jgi:hypothetical protein
MTLKCDECAQNHAAHVLQTKSDHYVTLILTQLYWELAEEKMLRSSILIGEKAISQQELPLFQEK